MESRVVKAKKIKGTSVLFGAIKKSRVVWDKNVKGLMRKDDRRCACSSTGNFREFQQLDSTRSTWDSGHPLIM